MCVCGGGGNVRGVVWKCVCGGGGGNVRGVFERVCGRARHKA